MAKSTVAWQGTRAEILQRLCTSDQTVADLSESLKITRTAVREHLTRLADDGLVEHEILRRGVGKPAHRYRLTSQGAVLFSRAYLPMLQRILLVLADRLSAKAFEDVLRTTGRGLAPVPNFRSDAKIGTRAKSAARVLRELGGLATARENGGSVRIECSCCAISAVVVQHPLACKAMESMLSEYLGAPVQERCDRTGRPKCRFELRELAHSR